MLYQSLIRQQVPSPKSSAVIGAMKINTAIHVAMLRRQQDRKDAKRAREAYLKACGIKLEE